MVTLNDRRSLSILRRRRKLSIVRDCAIAALCAAVDSTAVPTRTRRHSFGTQDSGLSTASSPAPAGGGENSGSLASFKSAITRPAKARDSKTSISDLIILASGGRPAITEATLITLALRVFNMIRAEAV